MNTRVQKKLTELCQNLIDSNEGMTMLQAITALQAEGAKRMKNPKDKRDAELSERSLDLLCIFKRQFI